MATDRKKTFWLNSIVLVLSVALLICFWKATEFVCYTDWSQTWFAKAEYTGRIGDFLAGTFGVLLSFVSMILVVITLRDQRKQFKLSQEEARRNRFEVAYYNMISMLDKTRMSANEVLRLKTNRFDTIIDCYIHFKDFYSSTGNRIEIEEDSAKVTIANKREEIASIYERFVEQNKCHINYYYRYIYHTFMFVVDEYGIENDDKEQVHKCLNVLQSQFSDEEMALLFYSSLSKFAQNKDGKLSFYKLLDKYQFFDNLNKDMLLEPSHYRFYPHTRFKFLNRDELKKVESRK